MERRERRALFRGNDALRGTVYAQFDKDCAMLIAHLKQMGDQLGIGETITSPLQHDVPDGRMADQAARELRTYFEGKGYVIGAHHPVGRHSYITVKHKTLVEKAAEAAA